MNSIEKALAAICKKLIVLSGNELWGRIMEKTFGYALAML